MAASVALLQPVSSTANQSSYTWSGQNLGAEAAGRVIHGCVFGRKAGAAIAADTVTCTIDGDGMALNEEQSGTTSNTNYIALFSILRPTGTSAEFTVNFGVSMVSAGLILLRGVGGAGATAYDTAPTGDPGSAGADPSVSIDCEAGGYVIALSATVISSGATWTGLTEIADEVVESFYHGVAADDFASAQTGLSITVDWGASSTQTPLLAVSFSPAAGDTELTVASAAHGHAADGATLGQVHDLAIAAAGHAHAADGATLLQVHLLEIASATHAHGADVLTVGQVHALAIAGATHGHTAASPLLAQVHSLAVAAATHGHAADQATLQHIHQLVIAAASHAHAAAGATLQQAHSLQVADALHAHLADNVSLQGVFVPAPHARRVLAGTVSRRVGAGPARRVQ